MIAAKDTRCMYAYAGCMEPPRYDVTPSGSVRKCQTHWDADNANPWGSVERVFYERGERRRKVT